MKSTALALFACVALVFAWTPAIADPGERDHDVVQAAIATAIEARGTDDYDAARAALYEIVTDPVTRTSCRRYADVGLVGLELIDLGDEYPDSEAVNVLFGIAMEWMATFKNDCLLAV